MIVGPIVGGDRTCELVPMVTDGGGVVLVEPEVIPDRWGIPKQTFLVEEGKKGDCWRCCIAAILNLPAVQVPHFLMDYGSGMWGETQKWLNKRGLGIVNVHSSLYNDGWYEDSVSLPVIATGPTIRSKDKTCRHAVVLDARNQEVLYDPHPSNAGLLATTDTYAIIALK